MLANIFFIQYICYYCSRILLTERMFSQYFASLLSPSIIVMSEEDEFPEFLIANFKQTCLVVSVRQNALMLNLTI